MFYEFTLDVPANTPVDTPYLLTVNIPRGTIEHVEVQFWAGAQGTVHARIREKEHQLWPSNVGEWFTGNDVNIVFSEQYQLEDAFTWLKLEAYNTDTLNVHQVIVRFGVSSGKWTLEDLVGLFGSPTIVEQIY